MTGRRTVPALAIPSRTSIVAWLGAALSAIVLACLFALLAFAFRGALHLPVAALVVFMVTVMVGLPTLVLGPILAIPFMRLARAHAAPRPLADCAIGAGVTLLGLVAAHLLFSPNQDWVRGLLGPIWVDVLCATTTGAIAGGVYWWLAGQPRPPYSDPPPA